MSPTPALSYARAHLGRPLAPLKDFVRIPSLSPHPPHTRDVRRCAAWLARHLKRVGMRRVRIVATRRHPIVLAEWREARGGPTVLVYGHYDVQPADPISAWKTPPFEPTVIGDDLF